MLQAAHSTTTTTLSRRHLLSGLAAGTATVTIATGAALALDPAPVSVLATDPVFALIEAHRAAWNVYGDAISAQSVIEERRFCTGRIDDESDPRWIEASALVAQTSAATDVAFERMAEATPVTLAGLSALAAYGLGREAACHGDEGSSDVLKTLARGLDALTSTTGRA